MSHKQNRMKKIRFDVSGEKWHGHSTEEVWAERVSEDKYRVENTPFFAKGVSFQDIVKAAPLDGTLVYVETVISAGHSTYRIIVPEDFSNEEFARYWGPLEDLGCTYESAHLGYQLFAVDVPPDADIHEVFRLLTLGETEGILGFEEGHCGHLV